MIFKPVDTYFNFLKTKCGFKGPYESRLARESYQDYVKGDIVIQIAYEGSYWVSLIKTDGIIEGLESGEKKLVDIENSQKRYYALGRLDPGKKIWNSVSDDNFPDKRLWYYSKLIRRNPEVLDGDFHKFTFKYRLLRMLGLRD